MSGSSSSRYHSFIREAEWDKLTLLFMFRPNIYTQHVHISKPRALHNIHPSSPGTLGSERFSGILHWSTWSFNAFTSSMSPGTLKIKHNSSVTLADHKRDLYRYHYRFSMPCSKTTTHAHSAGFKYGLVAESTALFVCSASLKLNQKAQ